ncbi:MAG: TetR/AcrR family transcriptional regulator [Acidimicrobiia bacterium]|nr:TetR/AcrR family transcriptional regulator [Acidimicrobiia bacterium]
MAPNPEHTRRALLDAAARLFAERGVDGVSLREITGAAGVRNSTALQYHFGDRRGVVRAVLARRHDEVEHARHTLLDAMPVPADLRSLAAAYVRPLAALLADEQGRYDLRIVADVVQRPGGVRSGGVPGAPLAPDVDPATIADSTDRWRATVAPLLGPVAVERLHRRFAAIRFTLVELARRAEGPPAVDDRLFTSHLVDLVTAVLAAPVSAETAQLLEVTTRR